MYRRAWFFMVIGIALLSAACGTKDTVSSLPTPPDNRPEEIQPAAWGAQVPTRTPSPTLPPTITPTETQPPAPPTGTATPTETPGPVEHVVQPNENCLGIASRYGHRDPDVVGEIERINGIKCSSLRQGARILIPLPTFTPTPIGADLTQTAVATAAPPLATLDTGPSYSILPYVVQDGDTLSSIAILHDSSLRQICELNPLPDGIDCGACTWESVNCCCTRSVLVSVGKTLNVPGPTPTPTPSPTFTGSETPTATPTHRAPQPVYPPAEATVKGAVRLTWLTTGPLAGDEHYLVTLRDDTTGATYSAITRQLSLDVPAEYLPQDGQAHSFVWQVSLVRAGEDGLFYPVGGIVLEQRFAWDGW